MKISKKLLEELAKQLFQDAEIVDDETGEGLADLDTLLSGVDMAREPIVKEKYKDSFHQEMRGKWSGSLLRMLKRQTGASEAILKAAANDEEAIKLAIDFYKENLGASNSDVEKTIQEMADKHISEMERVRGEYETKLNDSRNRFNQREISSFVKSQLKNMNIKPTIDSDNLVKIIIRELESVADLDFNETEQKVLVNKKGVNTPALNKSGNALFSWKEAIEDIISPLDAIAKDTGSINPLDAMGGADSTTQGRKEFEGVGAIADFDKAFAAAFPG